MRKDTNAKNIIFGAVGVILFWPALFAMNLKDAANTELRAYEVRNNTLGSLANQSDCETEHAYSMSEAILIAENQPNANNAKFAGSDANSAGGNVDVPSEAKGDDNRPATAAASKQATPVTSSASRRLAAPLAQTASASTQSAANPRNLQELMTLFVRGEISQSEYERLRKILPAG